MNLAAHIGPTAPVPRPSPKVRIALRLARPDDGPTIGNMLHLSGWHFEGVDWSNPSPNWLVAEIDELIVGCLCVYPARPFGWMEYLCVETELRPRIRAVVARDLLLQGLATLKAAGSQLGCGGVPDELKGYQKMLRNRGATIIRARGHLFAKGT